MGCAKSSMAKRGWFENDAVSLCRERKRLVKKAVKQRQVFAEAHMKYIHSLSSISSAIALFVSRYSSPSPSQFLVSFPPPPSSPSDFAPPQSPSATEDSRVCDPFYDAVLRELESEEREFKWDFFNLLDSEAVQLGHKKVVDEQGNENEKNGIEIENENGNEKGRELLEALKDVVDQFLRAYESGMDVSRMLEVTNNIPLHPPPEEVFSEIADRKQSISSRSLSCKSLLSSSSSTWGESRGDRKSLLSSSSDNSSIWMENRSDVGDGFSGMISGSHSFTLGRLYAWEKKLFHEVKAGEQTRKTYMQKCSQLRTKDLGDDELCPSKAASQVTDLYHQLLVAFQRAESISKQIEKLRDEELQPQLIELLHGLMRNWNAMLETHEIQKKIMQEIKSFSSPGKKFYNDSHHLATLQLEAVIQNWHSCFSEYVSSQKSYVKSLYGWLSKFVDAEAEYYYYYKKSSSLPPIRFNGPTLMITCHNWLSSLERLPDKPVKKAMKSLANDVRALRVQQGEEQKQNKKVAGFAKEFDRKIFAVKKAESKALILKVRSQSNMKDQAECLIEKKDEVEMFRKRVELERERHESSMRETKRAIIHGFRMGFASVFESLADFSRASVKVYADLVTFSQNQKV